MARQEAELGRPLDIIHVYHSGGEDWPTSTELSLISDPTNVRRLFVNWKPEAGSTWADVAAGANDSLIDVTAARIEARLGNRPFFLTLHHEPEQEVQGDGSGFSQSDYAAMFRHVVERLRLDGVTDAVIVWNMMGFSGWGDQGYYDAMYPGDGVVDWIGYDPYSHNGAPLAVFADQQGRVFPGFYSWATLVHPDKPLMLGEFGVDEVDPIVKASVFATLAAQARELPAIKAYVFFDHTLDSTTHGNDWAYDDDPTVLAAAARPSRTPTSGRADRAFRPSYPRCSPIRPGPAMRLRWAGPSRPPVTPEGASVVRFADPRGHVLLAGPVRRAGGVGSSGCVGLVRVEQGARSGVVVDARGDGDGVDRSVGMREVDVPADLEPDA